MNFDSVYAMQEGTNTEKSRATQLNSINQFSIYLMFYLENRQSHMMGNKI